MGVIVSLRPQQRFTNLLSREDNNRLLHEIEEKRAAQRAEERQVLLSAGYKRVTPKLSDRRPNATSIDIPSVRRITPMLSEGKRKENENGNT